MQDLLMPSHRQSSKKDDSVMPDDDVTAAEPLTRAGAASSSPSADIEEDLSPQEEAVKSPTGAATSPHDELLLASTGQPLLRIPAVGLMFADTLYGAPTLLPELVNRWGAVHKILIILTVRQVCTCQLPALKCFCGFSTAFYLHGTMQMT